MHKSQIEMILRDLLHKLAVLEEEAEILLADLIKTNSFAVQRFVSDKADDILRLAYSSLVAGPTIGQPVELSPTGDSVVPVQPELNNAKILTADDILHLIALRQTSRIRMNAKLDGEFFKACEIRELTVFVDDDKIEIRWRSAASKEYGEHELVITEDDKPIDFLPGRDVGDAHTYQLYVEKLEFKV